MADKPKIKKVKMELILDQGVGDLFAVIHSEGLQQIDRLRVDDDTGRHQAEKVALTRFTQIVSKP